MAGKGTNLTTNKAGSAWVQMLVATKSWTPTASIADGAEDSTTITVNGAVKGDPVHCGHDGIDETGVILTGNVISASNGVGTVDVNLRNDTGGALTVPAGTLKVVVLKI